VADQRWNGHGYGRPAGAIAARPRGQFGGDSLAVGTEAVELTQRGMPGGDLGVGDRRLADGGYGG